MANEIWTIKRCLEWTKEYLAERGEEHPRLSAEWLLCAATGLARIDLYMRCLLYTSPSPRDRTRSRMPSSA